MLAAPFCYTLLRMPACIAGPAASITCCLISCGGEGLRDPLAAQVHSLKQCVTQQVQREARRNNTAPHGRLIQPSFLLQLRQKQLLYRAPLLPHIRLHSKAATWLALVHIPPSVISSTRSSGLFLISL